MKKKKKFLHGYGVECGDYHLTEGGSWTDLSAQAPGCAYKIFGTRKEAEKFIRSDQFPVEWMRETAKIVELY